MGYHGFGMRKEVYKRKPKKAFHKVKKHIKKNPYKFTEKSVTREREVYIHTYHKPAYRRWWFLVVAIAAVLLIRYTYLNTFVWPVERLEKKVADFENGGILDYYHHHKATFDSLRNFINTTEGTLHEIGKNLYYPQAELGIISRSYGTGRSHHYFRPGDEERIAYRVDNDVLKYVRFDIGERQTEDWILEYDLDNIKDLHESFLEHMGVERQDLDHYLRLCFEKRWSVSDYSTGISWQFRQHDERYEIFILNNSSELTKLQKREMKELLPGIYWQ